MLFACCQPSKVLLAGWRRPTLLLICSRPCKVLLYHVLAAVRQPAQQGTACQFAIAHADDGLELQHLKCTEPASAAAQHSLVQLHIASSAATSAPRMLKHCCKGPRTGMHPQQTLHTKASEPCWLNHAGWLAAHAHQGI